VIGVFPKELVQQIAMRAVDLDGIESGGTGVGGGQCVGLGELG
jgi:hypothetical protein